MQQLTACSFEAVNLSQDHWTFQTFQRSYKHLPYRLLEHQRGDVASYLVGMLRQDTSAFA